MMRLLMHALLVIALLAPTACNKSETEEPPGADEQADEQNDDSESAINPSINTPLTGRQIENQKNARETINSENAVEVLTELEQDIQEEIDALQVQFDELGMQLPDD